MEALRPNSLDHAAERSHDWLHGITLRLGCTDARTAYCVLQSVLHLIRDRLPLGHAASLGARLPLMIRGLYYDRWKPHACKPRVRHLEEFLGLLERALRERSVFGIDPQRAIDTVFDRLRIHLQADEVAALVRALPPGMQLLFDDTRMPSWRLVQFVDSAADCPA